MFSKIRTHGGPPEGEGLRLCFVVMSLVTKKDTGDIIEEILILETALLTDLIHCF